MPENFTCGKKPQLNSNPSQNEIQQSDNETISTGLTFDDFCLVAPDHWRYCKVGKIGESGSKLKQPFEKSWQTNTYDKHGIKTALKQKKCQGFGLVAGDGLILLDVDGELASARLREVAGSNEIPVTVGWTSGKQGRFQLAFNLTADQQEDLITIHLATGGKPNKGRWYEEIPSAGEEVEQLDFRYAGHQSVLPPSPHPDTAGYKWLEGQGIADVDVAEMPDWLFDYLLSLVGKVEPVVQQQKPMAQLPLLSNIPIEVCLAKTNRGLLSGTPQGGRNDSGAKLARDLIGTEEYLLQAGYRVEQSARSLFDRFCGQCSPAIDSSEAEQIWRSAEGDKPGPCLSGDKIENCVKGWQRRQGKDQSRSRGQREKQPGGYRKNKLKSVDNCLGGWSNRELYPEHEDVHVWREQSNDPANKFVRNFKQTDEKYFVEIFERKTDWDIEVLCVLEDKQEGTGGGYKLAVRQSIPGNAGEVVHNIILLATQTTTPKDFYNALKQRVGRDLLCLLKEDEIQVLLDERRTEYYLAGGRDYRLIDRVGQQADGQWVFENCQFTKEGIATTEKDSGWVWNPALGEVEKVPSPQIKPANPEALSRLARASEGFFHPEALPLVWLTCGFVVANLNWQQIMKTEKKFPQLSLYGDPGGGKSTAADIAMSLVGLQGKAVQRFSESVSYETVKLLSGLPFWLDDPIKKGMKVDERNAVDNFLWSLHNGFARKVRNNTQEPHTACVCTSNPAMGEGNGAIESRLLKIYFPVKPTTPTGFQALREAMRDASGQIGDLIAIGYPKNEIDKLERQIVENLHSSHARTSQNLALLTYYTQQFCDLSGVKFDALQYCLKNLCPAADELESDKDSLTDFIEKLEILRSRNLIGEWNCATIESREGEKYLALYGPGVWEEFSKQFSVNYSRQAVEKLAAEKGSIRKPAKFVDSQLTWTEYQRAKAQALVRYEPEPPKPSRTATRKAILIPWELVEEILDPSDSEVTSTAKLPVELPGEVTCESPVAQDFQPQVTQVTQVSQENSLIVFESEKQIENYTVKLNLASQQNGHSRAALTELVREMEPLPKAIRQGVWDRLPKELAARIQFDIVGKPLNKKGVA